MKHSLAGSVVEQAEPAQFPRSPAEYLYHFLDDRVVYGPDGNWRTRVYGVIASGEELWVQMSVSGPVVHSILLRAGRSTQAIAAIRGVEFWLRNPHIRHDRIIDVAKAPPTLQA